MAGCLALVRVRIPDRPGALGLVASRIGALKGDIVGIEVLDRGDGSALDELAVVLPDESLIPALIREIAEVDGTIAESVVVLDAFPEPRLDALQTAAALCGAPSLAALAEQLAVVTTNVVRAEWVVIVGENLRAGSPDAPAEEPDGSELNLSSPTPIGTRGVTLHLARSQALTAGEQAVIHAYCAIADRLWDRASSP